MYPYMYVHMSMNKKKRLQSCLQAVDYRATACSIFSYSSPRIFDRASQPAAASPTARLRAPSIDMEHSIGATRTVKLTLPEMLAQKDDRLYFWVLIPLAGGEVKLSKFRVTLNGSRNVLAVRVPVPADLAVDGRLIMTRIEVYKPCSVSRTDGEAFSGAVPWGWCGSWVVKPHLFEIKPPMAGAWRFKLSTGVLAADQEEGEKAVVPPPLPALSINHNSSDANLSTASNQHAHRCGEAGEVAPSPALDLRSCFGHGFGEGSPRLASPRVEGSPPLRSSPLARDPARMGVPCAYPPSPSSPLARSHARSSARTGASSAYPPSPSGTRSMPPGASPTPHSLRETLPALHEEHLRRQWFESFVPVEKNEPDDGPASDASPSNASDEDNGPSLLKRIHGREEFSSDASESSKAKRSASAPPQLYE